MAEYHGTSHPLKSRGLHLLGVHRAHAEGFKPVAPKGQDAVIPFLDAHVDFPPDLQFLFRAIRQLKLHKIFGAARSLIFKGRAHKAVLANQLPPAVFLLLFSSPNPFFLLQSPAESHGFLKDGHLFLPGNLYDGWQS